MEYLAQIRKITQEEIEVLTQYEEDYFFENDQLSLSLDTDFKYSWKIECIEESMLRISKHGLNAATFIIPQGLNAGMKKQINIYIFLEEDLSF